MEILNLAAGLAGLQRALTEEWIGPAFIIALAVSGALLWKEKSFRNVAILVGVAIVGSIFIFRSADFFGSDGTLTEVGTELGKKVNNGAAD